jgi:hypothetical protein
MTCFVPFFPPAHALVRVRYGAHMYLLLGSIPWPVLDCWLTLDSHELLSMLLLGLFFLADFARANCVT